MNPSDKKIILIEDEDFIRDLYVRQLSKAGFVVKSAPDGQTGLNLLKSEVFDILLLDIMLPGINGLQVLREFKTQNPNSKMITILLTNLGQEAVIKEGFELGAQAFLIKASYTPDQVVNEVRNALFGMQTTMVSAPQVESPLQSGSVTQPAITPITPQTNPVQPGPTQPTPQAIPDATVTSQSQISSNIPPVDSSSNGNTTPPVQS